MTDIRISDGTIPFTEEMIVPATPKAGDTMVSSGTASGLRVPPMRYTRTRDGVTIPGATGRVYRSDPVLDGNSVVVTTITDAAGNTATPSSRFLKLTARAADFTIAFAGPANVGQPCTFTASGDFGQPHVRFEPVWTVDGAVVGTNLYYTFKAADQGKPWTLTVPGINATGTHTPAVLSGTVGAAGVIVPSGTRDPMLSVGTTGWTDYTPECPALDWTKTGRFQLTSNTGSPELNLDQMDKAGHLNAAGWFGNGFPAGYNNLRMLWALERFAPYAKTLNPFRVTWDGTGTITGNGISVSNLTSNSATVSITGSGNVWLDIKNIGTGTNHFRNMKMVPQKWAALYDSGEQFNPDYLDGPLRNVKTFRTLNWHRTFSSPAVELSDIKPKGYSSYRSRFGVPVQVMIDLCNRAKVDLWICAPLYATNKYFADLAALCRAQLHPDLTVIVEYVCENWNAAIGNVNGQNKYPWQVARGREYFTGIPDRGEYSNMMSWCAMRSAYMGKAFFDEYQGHPKKYIALVNIQTDMGQIGNSRHFIVGDLWKESRPAEYFPPYEYLDAIAGTCYISGKILNDDTFRDALTTAYVADKANGTNTSDRLVYDRLLDPNTKDGLPKWKATLTAFKKFGAAAPYNLDLICYEGGYHIIHSFGTSFDLDAPGQEDLRAALVKFDDSVLSQEVTASMFDSVMAATDGSFMQLFSVGVISKYGIWHIYSDPKTPLDRGRLLQSMSMTQGNRNTAAITDGRYLRPY